MLTDHFLRGEICKYVTKFMTKLSTTHLPGLAGPHCVEGHECGRAGPEYRWWQGGGAGGPGRTPLRWDREGGGEATPLSEGAGCSGNQSQRAVSLGVRLDGCTLPGLQRSRRGRAAYDGSVQQRDRVRPQDRGRLLVQAKPKDI